MLPTPHDRLEAPCSAPAGRYSPPGAHDSPTASHDTLRRPSIKDFQRRRGMVAWDFEQCSQSLTARKSIQGCVIPDIVDQNIPSLIGSRYLGNASRIAFILLATNTDSCAPGSMNESGILVTPACFPTGRRHPRTGTTNRGYRSRNPMQVQYRGNFLHRHPGTDSRKAQVSRFQHGHRFEALQTMPGSQLRAPRESVSGP